MNLQVRLWHVSHQNVSLTSPPACAIGSQGPPMCSHQTQCRPSRADRQGALRPLGQEAPMHDAHRQLRSSWALVKITELLGIHRVLGPDIDFYIGFNRVWWVLSIFIQVLIVFLGTRLKLYRKSNAIYSKSTIFKKIQPNVTVTRIFRACHCDFWSKTVMDTFLVSNLCESSDATNPRFRKAFRTRVIEDFDRFWMEFCRFWMDFDGFEADLYDI